MRYEYYLTLEQLKLLPNCKPHWKKVFEYAKLMENGIKFPAVQIWFNEEKNKWDYNDGRHRVMAAKLSGISLKVRSARRMGKWNIN